MTLLAACSGGNAAVGTDCMPGETRECYSGPDGTAGVGPCVTGLEVCSGGLWPGICIGDIVPRVEQCNMADDNCNGAIDDVAELGDACTGSNGCAGSKMCDDKGRIRCFAPAQNECDLCGGPAVADLGDECTSNGCLGDLVCSTDARSAVCDAPVQNECGVCGAAAVTGLGVGCMSTDGCTGEMACNAEGTAAVCNAPLFNECNACHPPVGAIGVVCTGDYGCVGVTTCNMAGDARVCTLDPSCGHVVISELATGSSVCNTDEFIELYNPTSRTISLAGFSLRSRTASSGNYTRLVIFAPTATIAPHGFYLVASARSSTGCSNMPNPGGGYPAIAANTVTADATYTAELSSTEGAIYLLTTDADPTGPGDAIVVDLVGYDNSTTAGNGTVFEGSAPTPNPEANPSGSVERKANLNATAATMAAGGADVAAGNAHDTGDNVSNFVAQAVRVPQNTSSATEP